VNNTEEDGFLATAPVDAFQPNTSGNTGFRCAAGR